MIINSPNNVNICLNLVGVGIFWTLNSYQDILTVLEVTCRGQSCGNTINNSIAYSGSVSGSPSSVCGSAVTTFPFIKIEAHFIAFILIHFNWDIHKLWTLHMLIRQQSSRSNNNPLLGFQGRLPVRWMAIESLNYSVYTTKSDVWVVVPAYMLNYCYINPN